MFPQIYPDSVVNKPIISYGLLVAGLLFCLYWSVLNPPVGVYYTTDEQFIADSGVLMVYGLTPRCFDWPAIPMVLVYYLLTLVHIAFDLLTHLSALHGLTGIFSRIDHTIAQYFADRTAYLLAGRVLQIMLAGGLLALLIRIINRADPQRLPPVAGQLLMLLLVLNTDLLIGTTVIRPEGLAYPLAMLLTGLILVGRLTTRQSLLWGLLLTALLISQRLIFAFLLPFWLGGLLLRTGRFSVRYLVQLSAGLLVALLLTMPFIWTDTLILVKAFAGGVLVKVNAPGHQSGFNWPFLWTSLQVPSNWIYSLTLIGGYVFIRQYPQRAVAWLLVGTLLLYGLMVFRSSTIYPTHTLPLRCLSLPLTAYGGAAVCQWLAERIRWWRAGGTLATGMFGILMGILFVAESVEYQKLNHQPLIQQSVLAWLQTLPATDTVLMPNEFEGVIRKSRSCLQRELEAIESPVMSRPKLNRIMSYIGGGNASSVLLEATLFEDEKAAIMQHKLLIQDATQAQPADTYFYSPDVGFINYYLPREAALDDFQRGRYTYLLTDQALVEPPLRTFNQGRGVIYFLYKSQH